MSKEKIIKPLDIRSFLYGWSSAITGSILGILIHALIIKYFL
jgi:hypothetical protein